MPPPAWRRPPLIGRAPRHGNGRATVARSGWLVRTGDEFRLVPDEPGAAAEDHLMITVHDLDDAELDALAADLAAACR